MLLDTSIIIDLFKGDHDILSILDAQEFIFLPAAALGELYLGAYRSSNIVKHLSQIQSFVSECEFLPVDAETAKQYAIIKSDLLLKGKPIPENDIWIAATAKQYQLAIFTKDKHFTLIDGINIFGNNPAN
ncbi:type II toxin-antitoxin system VapC family toxin [Mucilaginibacter terrigena]|uniref:type II toxin-antitoxin system VapC family toxin n=1 Tax=Mucilaginibacter terrigena TaxID=2492395 RepID=UPI001EF024F5|nr:type II toxin-antitoxin system VapC family toxin [Mucilaginibacter terrigena]